VQTIPELNIEIHPITQKALDLFVEKVIEHQGDNLLKIILYGSVARGEANEDSDIDVLIILKECPLIIKEEIWDLSSDVMWDMKFDVNAYLQALPISIESSRGLNFYGLMLNVNKEGVILYDTAQSTGDYSGTEFVTKEEMEKVISEAKVFFDNTKKLISKYKVEQ
jgi:hypothetical protein